MPAECSPYVQVEQGCGRPAGMPGEARAGEAWCRVMIPAQYEAYEEQVCVCPASTKREWIEPVYEEREVQVCCKPASCRHIPVPAEYEERIERVCVSPATCRRIPIPAKYEDRTERVCVRPATVRRIPIPAKCEDRTERVCVRPATVRRIPIPAQYEERSEQVCVCPARTCWVKVPCTPSQLAAGEKQGDCWMLKETPAQYKTVTRRVCVKPASFTTQEIPAQYKEVTRRVCVKPASFRTEEVPAEFEERTVRVCVKPASFRTEEVPAEFEERTVRVCVKPASFTTETIPAEFKTVKQRVMVKPGEWRVTSVPPQYRTVMRRRCVAPPKWVWRRNHTCEVPDERDAQSSVGAWQTAIVNAVQEPDPVKASGEWLDAQRQFLDLLTEDQTRSLREELRRHAEPTLEIGSPREAVTAGEFPASATIREMWAFLGELQAQWLSHGDDAPMSQDLAGAWAAAILHCALVRASSQSTSPMSLFSLDVDTVQAANPSVQVTGLVVEYATAFWATVGDEDHWFEFDTTSSPTSVELEPGAYELRCRRPNDSKGTSRCKQKRVNISRNRGIQMFVDSEK